MPARIADMAPRLVPVPGVRAVSLVGSRVRGTHRPDSDRDPGVCCRGVPDVAALTAPASEVRGAPAEVAGPGGWGPWEAAWEAEFLVEGAHKSSSVGDTLHVAPCLSRAFGILAQSFHAHHRVWCLNEKGAPAVAAALPDAPRTSPRESVG